LSRRVANLAAFAAAALVPAGVAALNYLLLGLRPALALQLGLAVLLLCATAVIVLGVPAILILLRLRRLNAATSLLAGFLIGFLPTALWSLPLWGITPSMSESYWNGHVLIPTVEHGVVTWAGWIRYLRLVGLAGAFGAVGGAAFWWVRRRLLR
jgi:uncharacterized membrane protein required for colicin V production